MAISRYPYARTPQHKEKTALEGEAREAGPWAGISARPRAETKESEAPSGDASGFLATVGGSATANGTDTFAEGDINLRVIDTPRATIARGTIELTASAASPTGEAADTDIETWATADGADYVFVLTIRRESDGETPDGSTSYESATTKFFAIDLKHIDRPDGPLLVERTIDLHTPHFHAPPGGNFASVNAGAQTRGDVFAYVATDAISVEDQFSHIEGNISSGIA